MSRISRFLTTARYLSARQLATRAARVMERQWWRLRRPRTPRPLAPAIRPHVPLWTPMNPNVETLRRARAVIEERFEFLNVARVQPRWDEPSVSQLWRYHLNYFEYLRDVVALAAAGERCIAFEVFRRLAESWIAANDRIAGDPWHPYTVSLRIVAWCETADAFREELQADDEFDTRFLASLYGQTRFLARHLEHDVRGNHLLKNLRALIWAGTFFDGDEATRWRARAVDLLQEETQEQVLADGGHFERAPGYHVQVLRDLAETAQYLRRNGVVLPWLDEKVACMRRYLATVAPPGGRLPLLKDTHAVPIDDLVDLSAAQPSGFLEPSGYAIVRDDASRDFLIADFGSVCPDYLPAHAHADMFSFELTIGGRPTVVDSGVYEYERGVWRDWFRSTAAHNTVELARRNQSDVWDRFRVAARARPLSVRWIGRGDFILVQGSHDGYAPSIHRRTIVAAPRHRLWLIVDEVRGGRMGDTVRSRIHLHPDLTPADVRVATFGAERMTAEDGWYSEDFGVKVPNRVVVLETTTPAFFGYAISADDDVSVSAGDGAIEVASRGVRFRVLLPPDGPPQIE